MKIKNVFFACIFLLSSSFADDLRTLALESGLKPIPSDKNALEQLINDVAPDSKEYPFSVDAYELGKKLYFDPRLSKSGIISCNTCHNLSLGGVDGVPASTGHKWMPNPSHVNSPTVFNSVFNSVQFWDGRAAHLTAQAKGPLLAPVEMASTPKLIEQRLKSIPAYVYDFKKAFNSEIKFDLVAAAIGIFERSLITPSKFDKFLEGDNKALNDMEKKGLKTFIDKGCASCHDGVNLGGTLQPFEVANKYEFSNIGDFKGDKNGLVKTPTLRNIELTAPYFHNGVVWSLEEAVKIMGSVQLGIDIKDNEAKDIAIFLKSLTGDAPKIDYPILPASTKTTSVPELDY
ncbi:cytochrome-c peroxidase [Campylobacter pinnipediorum]|uniref:cytochrome-c peroxidase n=1 Tax=Campylobacter pinnipediorum TaxID=1965231 RepID=UPI000995A788|nr:cytochrome-c peroxidase [Campylobacter pinnipediorum]AQW83714.1 periplasmic diheme cytochrome c peroxidase [Campylobacter pinnipediorum subsp. pinnipediorum]